MDAVLLDTQEQVAGGSSAAAKLMTAAMAGMEGGVPETPATLLSVHYLGIGL